MSVSLQRPRRLEPAEVERLDPYAFMRLHDMGGMTNKGTFTVGSTINVPAGTCKQVILTLFNPSPKGLAGSLVIGWVADANGNAVLDNAGVVLPTMISKTSQGGAILNLDVCSFGAVGETIPAGSIFHYQIIGR